MNVKGNMLISNSCGLARTFFCPSCGDESTAMGAAFKVAEKKNIDTIHPIKSLFKGPRFSNDDIYKSLQKYQDLITWDRHDEIEKIVASLLKNGNIIARFKGPSEWGARALGNRSILCRADSLKIIHRLNKSIKMRDFWMPFAPSVLEEDYDLYIDDSRKTLSPFMMMSFQTREKAQNDIVAALHPFDNTCRVQTVNDKINPQFHLLLKHFKKQTGYSGLLNTSFNLHGSPIVGTPEIAINTLLSSKLDYLAIENYLVRRKET